MITGSRAADSAFPPRPTAPARGPGAPAPSAFGAAFHHRTPESKNTDKAAQQTPVPPTSARALDGHGAFPGTTDAAEVLSVP
ncbi:hypothetical protein GCM10009799_21230 [Nocardiopsis rhodophaea]|uniref:Uncharacterized protein n=1 Tax=Nocardiopsis rhodophaea TaxID=280238 RepID=A0ABN2SZ05_9ACTN